MEDSKTDSTCQTDKERLLRALRTHSINTLPELRRIEKIFTSLGATNTTQGMKNAWIYYVNSNNLLNELRGLTKDYPFSSECLNEAKTRVSSSPTTEGRSQNYCWLVLERIKSQ